MKLKVTVSAAALSLLLVVLAASGCNEPTKTAPPVSDGYLPQSSPVNVLANLKKAYEERKLDKYMRLFSDDYVFVFSPADVLDPVDPTPVQWYVEDEQNSTAAMFSDLRVLTIQLDFEPGVVQEADSSLYGARTLKMKIDGARLSVNTRTEDGGQLTFFVPGTTEVFYFRSDPSRPATDGKPGLYIIRWEDQPIGAGKTENKSWGDVKNIYAQPLI